MSELGRLNSIVHGLEQQLGWYTAAALRDGRDPSPGDLSNMRDLARQLDDALAAAEKYSATQQTGNTP